MGFSSTLEDKFLPHPQPHWTHEAPNNFWTNTPGSSCSDGNTGRETSLFSERKNHCYHPTCAHCLSGPSLCNTMDHGLPGSAGHGIFQARMLELVAISFSRVSSWSRIKPSSPALQADSLPLSHLRSLHAILSLLHWNSVPSNGLVMKQTLSGNLNPAPSSPGFFPSRWSVVGPLTSICQCLWMTRVIL